MSCSNVIYQVYFLSLFHFPMNSLHEDNLDSGGDSSLSSSSTSLVVDCTSCQPTVNTVRIQGCKIVRMLFSVGSAVWYSPVATEWLVADTEVLSRTRSSFEQASENTSSERLVFLNHFDKTAVIGDLGKIVREEF